MEQMCWRTKDWEDISNIKRTYEELISFIAKNRENILRSNFENAIVTLSFVSAGHLYFALNIVLGKISLHCGGPILKVRSIQQGSWRIFVGVLHRMASRVVLPKVWAARRSAMTDPHLPCLHSGQS